MRVNELIEQLNEIIKDHPLAERANIEVITDIHEEYILDFKIEYDNFNNIINILKE